VGRSPAKIFLFLSYSCEFHLDFQEEGDVLTNTMQPLLSSQSAAHILSNVDAGLQVPSAAPDSGGGELLVGGEEVLPLPLP
jgi:hypothetical protein